MDYIRKTFHDNKQFTALIESIESKLVGLYKLIKLSGDNKDTSLLHYGIYYAVKSFMIQAPRNLRLGWKSLSLKWDKVFRIWLNYGTIKDLLTYLNQVYY
jgi:hypothetical protein